MLNVYNRKPQDEIIASQQSDKVKLVESKSCYEATKRSGKPIERENRKIVIEACEATYTKNSSKRRAFKIKSEKKVSTIFSY